jgi:hypothetical protein
VEVAMKKTLILTGILLALWVPMALAGGVDINWGSGCWSDGTPVNDLAWICNRNAGSMTMTCSFAVSQAQPEFVGIELQLGGVTEAAIMPAWWQMALGECRASAISTSADFLSAPQIGCVDMWQNAASGGLASYDWGPLWGGNNRAHILVVYAVPADTPIPLDPDVEYYAAHVRVMYAKTVGTPSCEGCLVPMLWNFYSLKAAELTQYEMLTEALPGGNHCLRWQHSTLVCPCWDWPSPTRNTTWGQVKSLYR